MPVKRVLLLVLITFFYSFAHAGEFSKDDYNENLYVLGQTGDSEEFQTILNQLKENHTYELRNAVRDKLDAIMLFNSEEIDSDVHNISKIISQCLDFYREVGGDDEVHQLSDLQLWVDYNIDNKILSQKIYETALYIGGKSTTYTELPSINEVLQDQSRALTVIDDSKQRRQYELALSLAEELLSDMRSRVIEQDEVLNDLQTLFVKDTILDGQRDAPEVFYLMGGPGLGKDTIAEAYVDSMWQETGAHKRHMFRMNVSNKAEIWTYLGSAKGYVGSSEIPAFLRFLVEHSGGKYRLARIEDSQGREKIVIERNPEWNGTYSGTKPHRAVVFVNEAHNIPKEVKDNILKQAIEKGIFPINNPGPTPGSVDHLEIPVTFVFASNEGISLIEPREKNGTRMGDPLSYEQLKENWIRVKDDKAKLKQAILEFNGEKNDPVTPDSPGTSEEFLSRIPSSRIHMLKPISPDGLKKIARLLEASLSARLKKATGSMGKFDIKLSNELVEFLVGYKAVPSDGARPLKDNLESYVFKPFYNAIVRKRIKPSGGYLTIDLDLKEYENSAKSISFRIFENERKELEEGSQPNYQFTRLISRTLNDIPLGALSDEEVQELMELREKIVSEVFGVEHIVDRLIAAVVTSESESRNTESKRSATVMAFLGKTSTGKTETAKQYVMARYGEDQLPTVIDFNGIRDLQAMKAKVLGTVDSRNNPIASDFMKAYDKANGKLAFIFDEAANSPKELLKGLYEVLRESTVTGFSDGKPRPMKDVTIILTGNAGEEIYEGIPSSLSTRRYAQAMEEVFRVFIKNESLQSKILNKTFPDALLARIGRNIFHFGPLSNKSKREIAQLKLLQGIKRLMPKPSERGWHIKFNSEDDLLEMFHMIEVEGYNQSYQGASIDKFIKEGIIDAIKAKLLTSGFPNNSTVVLSLGEYIKSDKEENNPPHRIITLTSEKGRQVELKVDLQRIQKDLPKTIESRLMVTYHEVGHEIVSNYYFNEVLDPVLLKILPGVSIIDNELVAYEGLRSGLPTLDVEPTKEMVLRRAAVWAGGYTAEQVVSLGNRHGAGKANDIKRATAFIQQAILKWGLSDEWDRKGIPANISMSDYIDKHLSEKEKEKLHKITLEWLAEAEEMALTAIISNLDGSFYNLSKALAKSGDMDGDDIRAIYSRTEFVYHANESTRGNYDPMKAYKELREIVNSNKKRLLEKYTINDALSDPTFYQKAFNDSAKWHAGLLGFFNRKEWKKLNPHEQLMAKTLLSGIFDDKSLTPRFTDNYWKLNEVVDPDRILEEREITEKEGVIEMNNFDINTTYKIENHSDQVLTCKGALGG